MAISQVLTPHQQTVIKTACLGLATNYQQEQSQATGQKFIVVKFDHRLTVDRFVNTLIEAGFTNLTCLVNGSEVRIPYTVKQ